MHEYKDIGRWERDEAMRKETKRRKKDPEVADNMEVRKDLIRRMEAGIITFDEMQAELKAIKRKAKREGRQTLYGN